MSGVRCGPVSAGEVLEGKPVLVRGLGEGFAGRAGILLFAVIVRRLQLTFTVRHGSVPVGEAVQESGDGTLLLALLCGAIETALHFLDSPRWRIAGIGLAVLLFLTVWAHLAVGLFD